jgi:hypothetical protein
MEIVGGGSYRCMALKTLSIPWHRSLRKHNIAPCARCFSFWLGFSPVRRPIFLDFSQNISGPKFVGPNSFVLFLSRIVKLNLRINSGQYANQNIYLL